MDTVVITAWWTIVLRTSTILDILYLFRQSVTNKIRTCATALSSVYQQIDQGVLFLPRAIDMTY